MQDIVHTTLPEATIIVVTSDNLHLFVPNFMPSPETKVEFDQSMKNIFTLSFDSGTTDREVVNTGTDNQLHMGSSVRVNSPKFSIAAHQAAARAGFANKSNNASLIDRLDVRKYHVEIDTIRYPKESVNIIYARNECLDPYGDLKML